MEAAGVGVGVGVLALAYWALGTGPLDVGDEWAEALKWCPAGNIQRRAYPPSWVQDLQGGQRRPFPVWPGTVPHHRLRSKAKVR